MLVYNEDWIHFTWTRHNAGIDITEKELRDYIYSLKGTQITDFMMCVNGTVSNADSRVLETYADKYEATEEGGVPVNFKNTFAAAAYKLIREKKIDMYAVWIDTLREIGINPWLSFRMNDCHGNDHDVRKSAFATLHPEYYVCAHTGPGLWFDSCLDYRHAEVREKMLAYIDEMLSRYDVYGVELDWMRDLFFVRFGEESVAFELVNKLMRDIFAIVKKYEEKYGHEIKTALILPPSPNLVIERGMNIFDFIDEVDYITVIARWMTSDTDMPVELWKQLLRGTNVKLGGGQQLLYKPYSPYQSVTVSVNMAFGEAIANLSRGCDYVYLYNYMDMAEMEKPIGEWTYEASIRNDNNRPLIFNNIGKRETLVKTERSHVVTYSDFSTYDCRKCPKLPMVFTGNEMIQRVKVNVGDLPEDPEIKLILGITESEPITPDDMTVFVNCERCGFIEKTRIEPKIFDGDCYVFSVVPKPYPTMYAEIKIPKKCEIRYVEINVSPKA